MSEGDLKSHCLKLRAENEILKVELEESMERESSLKRQMAIMEQLRVEQP